MTLGSYHLGWQATYTERVYGFLRYVFLYLEVVKQVFGLIVNVS